MPTRFRYVACLVALALAVPATAIALPSLARNPANALLGRGMDPQRYDRATHCNGGKVWPGTKAMVAWLEHNAAGVNWGEYRCEKWGKGSASVHSDGRAIDWHPATNGDARRLIALLLAPDRAGNPTALARRMGVQGLIFDCRSWWGSQDGRMGPYSYCYTKRGMRKKHVDPTQAHMDHVHIELNELGAARKTTFWNRRVDYPTQEQTTTTKPTPTKPTTTAPSGPEGPSYPNDNGGSGWNYGGNWDGAGGQYGGADDPYWP